MVSDVAIAPELNCAYTVFRPVPAESVHALVAANASRDDRMALSLENLIVVSQAPVILRVTQVTAVEAASLSIVNDHVAYQMIAKSVI